MKFYGCLCIIIFNFVFVLHAQKWQKADSLCMEYTQHNPDSAIFWGRIAFELCKKEKTEKDTSCVICLSNLAWAYHNKNELKIADSLLNVAKFLLENSSYRESMFYAEIINNLAFTYRRQNRYTEAEILFKEAMRIVLLHSGKKSIEHFVILDNLGEFYLVKGFYAQSELFYKQAAEVLRELHHKKSEEYAYNLMALGNVNMLQGRYSEAESLLKEAKKIIIDIKGKNSIEYAVICNNLSRIYDFERKYRESEELLKEAEQIYIKILDKDKSELGTVYNNLAVLYLMQGRSTEAEIYCKKAQEIYLQNDTSNYYGYVTSISNLGKVYFSQNKYEQAETMFQQAIELYLRCFSENNPNYATFCKNLAQLYYAQNKYNLAESLFKKMIHLKSQEIEQNFKGLSENEKESYVKANLDIFLDSFLYFACTYYPNNLKISEDAYNLILQTKGLILQSSEKVKNRILNSKNSELKALYLQWRELKEQFAKVQSTQLPQQKNTKSYLDSINKLINETEKNLSLKSEDFAHFFISKPYTWKDIQQKLKKNEAAIEIVRINVPKITYKEPDSIIYAAIIVKKSSAYPEIVKLAFGNQLEKEFFVNYKRSIKHKIYDGYSYDAYWKPIQQHLAKVQTVFFSPDGIYHQINLNTLQNPNTKKYIADEIQIVHITTTKDLLEDGSLYYKPQAKSYFIGNPKYYVDLYIPQKNIKPEAYQEFSDLPQLAGAEQEVIQNGISIPNSEVCIGYDATEEYVKSIKNPRILHIATHGYFKKGQYQSSTQAMLNAGLLFSGVVDYDRMNIRPLDKEDGKLTAFEVMNMELDSTELVVLSACETGLGQASKEGVYGLQRAFKVAGAQSIIMSLWKVNDEATQLLMTKFYENWQKKRMDKRKAFETAQKELRKIYKEPYYWGAFVMIE